MLNVYMLKENVDHCITVQFVMLELASIFRRQLDLTDVVHIVQETISCHGATCFFVANKLKVGLYMPMSHRYIQDISLAIKACSVLTSLR